MSAFDQLTAIPCAIVSGEAAGWAETLPEYADPDYVVSYCFAGQTAVDGFRQFTITGTGAGTSWTFAFPTGNNAPKPGRYD